jgi:hypothetical protein
MKRILFSCIIFFLCNNIFAQKEKLNEIFDKYQEVEGITSIKIAKPMFNMLSQLDINDEELQQIKPLLSKIDSIKILVMEMPEEEENVSKNKEKMIADFKNASSEIFQAVKNLNYEELMSVNSRDNKIKFLSSGISNGFYDNLLLSVNSDNTNVLLMLDGKISINEVSHLINSAQEIPQKYSNEKTSSVASSERKVADFKGIQTNLHGITFASSPIINFTQGKEKKVELTGDENKLSYIKTEVQDGILRIYVDKNLTEKIKFKKLLINIENPQLEELALSAGVIFNTKNIVSGEKLKANISSGAIVNANFKMKNIEVEGNSGSILNLETETNNLQFFGNSGAIANLKGTAENASFKLSSGTNCEAQNLVTKNATINVSSGAIAKVNATTTLNITAGSGAIVQYKGSAEVVSNVQKNSGAVIKKIN